MSSTWQTRQGRLVTYNDVTLPFTTLRTQVTPVYDQRGRHIKTEFVYQFTGVVTHGQITATGNLALGQMERLLQETRKTLRISENKSTSGQKAVIFEVNPASSKGNQLYSEPTGVKRWDVDGGPKPGRFEVLQFVGANFRYRWQIRFTLIPVELNLSGPAGDTSRDVIEGFAASVSYGIDDQHRVTRSVMGEISLAKSWLDDDKGDNLVDDHALRVRVISERLKHFQNGDDVLGVPDGFVRVSQKWAYSPDLTALQFAVVDQEQYRVLPYQIVGGYAKYRVKYDGIGYGKPLLVGLSGRFTAPKDVPKEVIMQRILQLAIIMLGSEQPFERFVTSFDYEMSLYDSNTIEFEYGGLVNFGAMVRASEVGAGAVLRQLGFGIPLADALDVLSNNGRAYHPSAFGTAGINGDAYSSIAEQHAVQPREGVPASVFVPYASPARTNDDFTKRWGNEYGVNENTVSLQPGEVLFLAPNNQQFYLTRDSKHGGQGSRGAPVIVQGNAQGFAFVGWSGWVEQVSVNAVYKKYVTALQSLTAFGTPRVMDSDMGDVYAPDPRVAPNAARVQYRTLVWILYINATIRDKLVAKYGASAEPKVNQAISKGVAVPGVRQRTPVSLFNLKDLIESLL